MNTASLWNKQIQFAKPDQWKMTIIMKPNREKLSFRYYPILRGVFFFLMWWVESDQILRVISCFKFLALRLKF